MGDDGHGGDARLRRLWKAWNARRLLSVYTGPSTVRAVQSSGGTFLIQVSGPGVIKENSAGRSGIDLSAFGTTSATTINITQVRPRWHFPSQYLALNSVRITSGQLGGLVAGFSELNGKMTALNNTLNTLELGSIGPKAQIDVNGNVGTMTVSQINLGPTGHVVISGQLNTSDLTGSMTIGGFTIDGGRFVIGQDSMAPIAVSGNMTISHDGLFSIGRDLDDSLSVNGNLVLDTGGQIFVGRNLSDLTVNGNVIVNPTGSGIVVNGALGGLSVSGIFQGQGGYEHADALRPGRRPDHQRLDDQRGHDQPGWPDQCQYSRRREHHRPRYHLWKCEQHDPAQHAAADDVSETHFSPFAYRISPTLRCTAVASASNRLVMKPARKSRARASTCERSRSTSSTDRF